VRTRRPDRKGAVPVPASARVALAVVHAHLVDVLLTAASAVTSHRRPGAHRRIGGPCADVRACPLFTGDAARLAATVARRITAKPIHAEEPPRAIGALCAGAPLAFAASRPPAIDARLAAVLELVVAARAGVGAQVAGRFEPGLAIAVLEALATAPVRVAD